MTGTSTTQGQVEYEGHHRHQSLDLYLLSLAETIGADYIVSGDADLTKLVQYNQTRIMKLADFKAMMQY